MPSLFRLRNSIMRLAMHLLTFTVLLGAADRCDAGLAVPPNFAIIAGEDVHLDDFSSVRGDVQAGRNILVGNAYGLPRRDDTIGDFYAGGDFAMIGNSDIEGDVFANGSVTMFQSAEVSGSVTYGTTLTKDSNSRAKSFDKVANSVSPLPLPAPIEFQPGTQNVFASGNLTLAPGAYGNVLQYGSFDNVNLRSGVYFLESLTVLNHSKFNLTIVDDQPIQMYVLGDIKLSTGTEFFVNGKKVDSEPDFDVGLASKVLFETHEDFELTGSSLSYFFGTIFAPFGDVDLDFEQMYGSVIAGGSVKGQVKLYNVPSSVVPETSSLVLACFGGVSSILILRRGRISRTS